MPRRDIVQQAAQHPVIGRVDGERFARPAPWSVALPHFEPPALLGSLDRPRRRRPRFRSNSNRERWTMIWVGTSTIAWPVNGSSSRRRSRSAKLHRRRDFGAQVVAVVDGGRDDRSGSALARSTSVRSIAPWRYKRFARRFGCVAEGAQAIAISALSECSRAPYALPMIILVTGAAGFIGSETCRALLARGEDGGRDRQSQRLL